MLAMLAKEARRKDQNYVISSSCTQVSGTVDEM